jgi:hypothetical protein
MGKFEMTRRLGKRRVGKTGRLAESRRNHVLGVLGAIVLGKYEADTSK